MTDQHYSNESTEKVVTVSQDDELRLNSTVYQSHFADIEYVRLGTHHELDLITVRPIDESAESLPDAVAEIAYKIDDRRYTGEISCQGFLHQHNYHHETTTKYATEWWPDNAILCVDLPDPVR